MKKVGLLLISLVTLFFTACNLDVDTIERDKILESITVDVSEAAKLDYLIGQELNTDGIKVIGHYSDESTQEEDLRLVTFDGFDSSTVMEELPITVRYEGFEDTFNISIKNTSISSIRITQLPKKLQYQIGEKIDTEGLIVFAFYDDGVTNMQLEPEEYVISGFDTTSYSSERYVYITYDGVFQTSYKISVVSYQITNVEIQQEPEIVFYSIGDSLNTKGLIVNAKRDNGTDMTLNEGDYQVFPADITGLGVGDHEIKISVNDVYDTYMIHIIEACVVDFYIPDYKGKVYCKGDVVKMKDFSFYEILSDGNKGNPCDYSKLYFKNGDIALHDEGIQEVVVCYEFEDYHTKKNKIVEYKFEVCASAARIEGITAKWSGTGYPLGITPDDTNSQYGYWYDIKGILSDGYDIDIDSQYCSFEFDTDFTLESTFKEIEESSFKQVTKNVVVSYYDVRNKRSHSTKVLVYVIPPIITDYKVTKTPRVNYYEGESFDIENMEFELIYSDGRTENKDSIAEKYQNYYSPNDALKTDVKQINFSFGNLEWTFDITVEPANVTGLSLAPTDTYTFREGKKYTTEEMLAKFNLSITTSNVLNPTQIDKNEGNLIKNVEFTIKNINEEYSYDEPYNKKGIVYVTYHLDNQNGKTLSTYCKGFKSDELQEQSIRLLPPLPISISVSRDKKTSNGTNIFTDKDTNYSIVYSNGTTESFTGDCFSNNIYDFNGFNYQLICTSNDISEIKYIAKDCGYLEDKKPEGTFELKIINNITFSTKDNYELRKGETYTQEELYDKFNVGIDYFNLPSHQATKDEFKNNDISFVMDYEKKNITCYYLINGVSYSNTITVVYKEPNPVKVEIVKAGAKYDDKNSIYKVYYKDNTSSEEIDYEKLVDLGFTFNFDTDDTITVTYKDNSDKNRNFKGNETIPDFITGISVEPKESYISQSEFCFRKGESYVFSNFFTVKANYFSEKEKTINDNLKFHKISTDQLQVKFTDNGKNYFTYQTITELCALPERIEIVQRGNTWNDNKSKYRIIYKDGTYCDNFSFTDDCGLSCKSIGNNKFNLEFKYGNNYIEKDINNEPSDDAYIETEFDDFVTNVEVALNDDFNKLEYHRGDEYQGDDNHLVPGYFEDYFTLNENYFFGNTKPVTDFIAQVEYGYPNENELNEDLPGTLVISYNNSKFKYPIQTKPPRYAYKINIENPVNENDLYDLTKFTYKILYRSGETENYTGEKVITAGTELENGKIYVTHTDAGFVIKTNIETDSGKNLEYFIEDSLSDDSLNYKFIDSIKKNGVGYYITRNDLPGTINTSSFTTTVEVKYQDLFEYAYNEYDSGFRKNLYDDKDYKNIGNTKKDTCINIQNISFKLNGSIITIAIYPYIYVERENNKVGPLTDEETLSIIKYDTCKALRGTQSFTTIANYIKSENKKIVIIVDKNELSYHLELDGITISQKYYYNITN